MNKRTNRYKLKLQLEQYANGESEPAKELELRFDNHDELFGIIEKIQEKNLFNTIEEATEFAIGLKMFSEVMIRNQTHPLFEDLHVAFPLFMKKLKSS